MGKSHIEYTFVFLLYKKLFYRACIRSMKSSFVFMIFSYSGKAGVLRLFPDLAGKLAHSGDLTSESQREHTSAGLDVLTPEEISKMAELNLKYQKKFDFPFVICARENKKEAIMRGLELRLNNTVDVEINNGLKEVMKICSLRLRDLISDSSDSKL